MTRRDILKFIFKWKSSIFGIALLTCILVSALAYTIPPSYQGVARVLVQGSQSPTIAAQQTGAVDIAALLSTEVEILLSRPVMEAVVKSLRLDDAPESTAFISKLKAGLGDWFARTGLRAQPDSHERWIQSLLRDTEAEYSANSQSLQIKFTHNQPESAAAIANAITESFIAYRLQVHKSKGMADFFDIQAKESKLRYESLIQEIELYRSAHALGAVDVARSIQSAALTTMIDEENRLRRDHIDIADKFGPAHVNSIRSLKRIELTKERIYELKNGLALLEQRGMVLDNMLLLIDAERTNHLNYLAEKQKAHVSAQSNPNTTNVKLIERAAVPQTPIVSRIMLIVAGLFAGLAFGISVAIFREYFDNRVLGSREFEEIFGVPVFGTLTARDIEI